MTESEAIALAQEWQHIAERCTREIVRMRKMIAEAPVVQVDAGDVIERLLDLGYYKGKPLALLPLDDEAKS